MHNETNTNEREVAGGRELSRRTVIKTAAHAVWAVPVISAVSAAPAYAAASDTFSISVSAASGSTLVFPWADITIVVDNSASGTLDMLTVLATFTTLSLAPSNWRISAQSPVPNNWTPLGPVNAPPVSVLGAVVTNGTTSSVTVRLAFLPTAFGLTLTYAGTVQTPSAFVPNSLAFSGSVDLPGA